MSKVPFFVAEPKYVALAGQRPDIVRLMHSGCAGVELRRVPPNEDTSILEVGLGAGGVFYLREPRGGTSQAQAWRPADGVVACATCWDSRRINNPVIDLATGQEFST